MNVKTEQRENEKSVLGSKSFEKYVWDRWNSLAVFPVLPVLKKFLSNQIETFDF